MHAKAMGELVLAGARALGGGSSERGLDKRGGPRRMAASASGMLISTLSLMSIAGSSNRSCARGVTPRKFILILNHLGKKLNTQFIKLINFKALGERTVNKNL